jgi:hypothetical protein
MIKILLLPIKMLPLPVKLIFIIVFLIGLFWIIGQGCYSDNQYIVIAREYFNLDIGCSYINNPSIKR